MMGNHEVADKGYIHTENSQMAFIGATINSTFMQRAKSMANFNSQSCGEITADCLLVLGLGNIENTTLLLSQQNHCDYCRDIALEYFITKTGYSIIIDVCPLETAIASLSIGMNLWFSMIVVGTNLISTLYCSIVMCTTW